MALFGILNVNKPAGLSSRAVVNHVERLVRPAKAGHAGTLDPLATGVLVICVGQATRLIQYVQRMPKRYRATFLLGHHSETDDVEGEVTVSHGAPIPTPSELESALPRFIGEIQQRPPAYSAVKIGGRRAYKLARAGRAVEPRPRTIVIHRIALVRYDYPELELDIDCGSGTYIRSLGRDLAAALGTSAVMSALERVAVGSFRKEDSIALEELTTEMLHHHLQPPLTALAGLPQVQLSEAEMHEVANGRPVRLANWREAAASPATEEVSAIDSQGRLVAIVREKRAGEFWPVRNFGSGELPE